LTPTKPKSDISNRLIAPLVEKSLAREGDAYASRLLRCLLVFDTYILQSVRLTEFAPLAQTLGVANVLKLLESGVLGIVLDPNQIAQAGQNTLVRQGPALPLGP
jgi:hypothetical protein